MGGSGTRAEIGSRFLVLAHGAVLGESEELPGSPHAFSRAIQAQIVAQNITGCNQESISDIGKV